LWLALQLDVSKLKSRQNSTCSRSHTKKTLLRSVEDPDPDILRIKAQLRIRFFRGRIHIWSKRTGSIKKKLRVRSTLKMPFSYILLNFAFSQEFVSGLADFQIKRGKAISGLENK
jgi:hypothetical protein